VNVSNIDLQSIENFRESFKNTKFTLSVKGEKHPKTTLFHSCFISLEAVAWAKRKQIKISSRGRMLPSCVLFGSFTAGADEIIRADVHGEAQLIDGGKTREQFAGEAVVCQRYLG
jgi:hypothetical protein